MSFTPGPLDTWRRKLENAGRAVTDTLPNTWETDWIMYTVVLEFKFFCSRQNKPFQELKKMRRKKKKKVEKGSSLCSEQSYANGETGKESETARASVFSGGSIKSDPSFK